MNTPADMSIWHLISHASLIVQFVLLALVSASVYSWTIIFQRRAVYADKAQAANATLEEYAFTAGCLAIARTAAGEKYQGPDGSWQTRGAGAPQRDPRCPPGERHRVHRERPQGPTRLPVLAERHDPRDGHRCHGKRRAAVPR